MTEEIVKQAWPDGVPDWVSVLSQAVKQHGPESAGKMIGYSRAAVDRAIKNRYPAKSLGNIEAAVRASLMEGASVTCPVLGQITGIVCERNRSRPYNRNNPLSRMLYPMCEARCPHGKGEQS